MRLEPRLLFRFSRSLLALLLLSPVVAHSAPPASAGPACPPPLLDAEPKEPADVAKALLEHYVKYEYRIPMRDGAKLYTVAYVPRNRTRSWPILMMRTPYSVNYGVDNSPIPKTLREVAWTVPSALAVKDGFIFVNQDVRGRMMSEGKFVDVRPAATAGGVDEATDAYDTIDFLVKVLPANSGVVGVWGISYPGFYAAQAAVDAHPALKAVSPQAPVTDWFVGDDAHHNGALFLSQTYGFAARFGVPRVGLTRTWSWDFEYRSGDLYEYFLNLGPLSGGEARKLRDAVPFWQEMMAHPTYDSFWKAMNPLPRYRAVRPAVLVVGGLFDAQNLWGALATYRAFDRQSPGADVRLVLGPWRHGGWARSTGEKLGDISFRWPTSRFYQERIELPFFRRTLKGCAEPETAEAWVFETGTNLFNRFDTWPPKVATVEWFFAPRGGLSTQAPSGPATDFDEWISDPAKPVPHRAKNDLHDDETFMSEDQRFAARRPDVVVHQSGRVSEDLTLAGPVEVNLWVSTTGTDADFVVKLIDVYPPDFPDPEPNPTGVHLGGYQQLVRAEVMRGRFRESLERPIPFEPHKPTPVRFTLPDVHHTFRPGHRVMLQVQSTWFPLVDLNPQTFVDIHEARPEDFRRATHRLLLNKDHRSSIRVPVLRGALP